MEKLTVDHLLGIEDLSSEDIQLIFKTADNFKEVINRPIKKVPSLRDVTIVNLFFENSTRTRISFELAEKRLSADVVNFSASSSSVSKGETLIDTVNNILSMKVDMVVMRHPSPGAHQFLSKHIDATIINAGDGTHEHPTQALLDTFSMREKVGDLKGKKVVIVGDIMHSRVALSNIHALKKLGAEVMLWTNYINAKTYRKSGCSCGT
jgi:aspartate carbamoyltransferase catalytic subunit